MRRPLALALALALAATTALGLEAETRGFFTSDPAPFDPARAGSRPRCMFIHGMGVVHATASGSPAAPLLYSTWEAYWGKMHDYVKPYCDPVFLRYESKHRGWDHPSVAPEVCQQIARVNPRVVITHSMGGLVLALGIKLGLAGCNRVLPRSQVLPGVRELTNPLPAPAPAGLIWVDTSSPFQGSQAADLCNVICRAPDVDTPVGTSWFAQNLPRLANAWNDAVDWSANKMQRAVKDYCGCLGSSQTPYGSIVTCASDYRSVHPANVQLRCTSRNAAGCTTMGSIADKYVSALQCGLTGHTQSWTNLQANLLILPEIVVDRVVGWPSPDGVTNINSKPYSGNDGFVPFQSCRAGTPGGNFDPLPTMRFYASLSNHADNTGRAGEAWFQKNQKPLTWVGNMAKLFAR